jgi:uncharacterized protein (TIGR03083 family)
MEPEAYLDAIHSGAERLAGAAAVGELSAPVPSCPGWAVADLVAHTGAVHRVWTYHLQERKQEPTSRFPLEILAGVPGIEAWADAMLRGQQEEAPRSPELIPWFLHGARRLEETLRATDLEEPIWHWSGDNRALSHYRMMAFETAVHGWDAERARGTEAPIPAPLAADGIGHTFEVMVPMRRRAREAPSGQGECYRFAPTDVEESWLLSFDPDGVEVITEPRDADVTVRGTASDLFLYLYHRVPPDALSVEGDAALLDRYFELVPPI